MGLFMSLHNIMVKILTSNNLNKLLILNFNF